MDVKPDEVTLLDYFAAHAMQGLLAFYGNPAGRYEELADQAHNFAEAMIAERERR